MYKAGPYEIHILETGRFALDAGTVFGLIPKALWEQKITTDSKNRMDMALRSILILGQNRRILVETGAGKNLNSKMKKIYKIDHSQYSLDKSLDHLGVEPEDITDVVNTHLHFDHCGGNVVVENGKCYPAFPKADYHVQKEQYNWAQSPTLLDRNSFLPENYRVIKEKEMLRLVEGELELFPGIKVITTRDHTPGQQHLLIDDKKEPVFFAADLFPLNYNFKATWISSLELFPVDFVREKNKISSMAANGNWRVIFPHDPEVISAQVKKVNKYYKLFNHDR